ncbi:site-specific DNA-methyltransferase [Methyloceanibacter caenitepidi]|uniref:Methyltransferase n=1 Tax=Methyloceanibacter caenitepidi TaxID=1384459 RepID=A0A0A8K0X5_9HYPH|nr:DNA methyltransferase [Methyloceanibacter caenitepidi]BAQ16628.1 DNA modification methylase [Methyloceanibacter caenitepidi]
MVEMLSPASLKAAKRNARAHNKAQEEAVANSILQFGVIKPVVIDEQSRIVAGHVVWGAAKKLGLKRIPVIRVSHLSETELRAYALADNQLATKSAWDLEILSLELGELELALPEIGLDLSITGFEPAEIDMVFDSIADGTADPIDEEVEPLEGPAVSWAGALFVLGRHRLLVGDARDETAFAQLMGGEIAEMGIHDPPYNVRIQGNVGGRGRIKRREFACASGEMTSAEFEAFLKETLGLCADNSIDGAIHYVFMDWRHIADLTSAGTDAFDELKNVCVWVKNNAGQGSFYRSEHEFVFVFKHGQAPHLNNFGLGAGGRNRSNVWRYAGVNTFRAGRMDELKMHPTVKPVAMIADAMRDCSRRGSIVLDAFAGSGTTIIAAEQTGRRAFCLEIDPHYADVAIRRWQKLTKRDATLESTGQTFDELTAATGNIPQPSKGRRS